MDYRVDTTRLRPLFLQGMCFSTLGWNGERHATLAKPAKQAWESLDQEQGRSTASCRVWCRLTNSWNSGGGWKGIYPRGVPISDPIKNKWLPLCISRRASSPTVFNIISLSRCGRPINRRNIPTRQQAPATTAVYPIYPSTRQVSVRIGDRSGVLPRKERMKTHGLS